MKTLLTRCFALAALAACVQGCCSTRTPAEAKPVSVELVRSGRSWDGAIVPPYPADPPELRILRIAIPAGARLPDHRHPVINAGVLTRGSLNVVAENGQTLELKAGDPIIEVVDTWHYGYNPGKTEAEIVVFYVGDTNAPITEYKPVTCR